MIHTCQYIRLLHTRQYIRLLHTRQYIRLLHTCQYTSITSQQNGVHGEVNGMGYLYYEYLKSLWENDATSNFFILFC